jgi:hypothetical protein
MVGLRATSVEFAHYLRSIEILELRNAIDGMPRQIIPKEWHQCIIPYKKMGSKAETGQRKIRHNKRLNYTW